MAWTYVIRTHTTYTKHAERKIIICNYLLRCSLLNEAISSWTPRHRTSEWPDSEQQTGMDAECSRYTHCPGICPEGMKNWMSDLMTVGVIARIWTGNPPNTNQKHQEVSILVGPGSHYYIHWRTRDGPRHMAESAQPAKPQHCNSTAATLIYPFPPLHRTDDVATSFSRSPPIGPTTSQLQTFSV